MVSSVLSQMSFTDHFQVVTFDEVVEFVHVPAEEVAQEAFAEIAHVPVTEVNQQKMSFSEPDDERRYSVEDEYEMIGRKSIEAQLHDRYANPDWKIMYSMEDDGKNEVRTEVPADFVCSQMETDPETHIRRGASLSSMYDFDGFHISHPASEHSNGKLSKFLSGAGVPFTMQVSNTIGAASAKLKGFNKSAKFKLLKVLELLV